MNSFKPHSPKPSGRLSSYPSLPSNITSRNHSSLLNVFIFTADIAEFMVELRCLSAHCKFQGYLEQALRDRLLCEIRNEAIQQWLLAEADISLAWALELAQGMEAERNA